MKKTQRLVTLLLMLCLMLNYSMLANAAELPPNTNENANAYSNDWVYWCQGASKYWGMRGYGCRMVAQSKLLVEAGVVQAGSFNPDVYFEWCKSNGYIDGKTMCELKCGQGPGAYARTLQKNLTYSKQVSLYGSKADRAAQIMSYLNNGYYVILGSAAHHAYVGRSASLRAGTPVIYDSWSGYSYNTATVQNYTSYTLVNFSYMWLFSTDEVAPPPPPSVHVVTGNVDTITETSAILRGSFTTTMSRATECGMLLGTSEGNMTKLGSDKVNTYGTSMFYSTAKYGRTLEPGTTYYYQAYATVNNTTYKGETKSFITSGTRPESLSISLNRDNLTLAYNTCDKLIATTNPAGISVAWKSSDASVVTVTDGVVATVGAGTAYITAEASHGGKTVSAICYVTVKEDKPEVRVTTKGADGITTTSAIVRGNVSVSNGTATECGMYFGNSASNLSFLGSDAINSSNMPFYYSTSKYGWTLMSGTTYYYRAYVIVNGVTYWGEIKSFTTEASAPVSNTRTAVVVNTNGSYLAINDRAAASPKYSNQIGRIPPAGVVTVYPEKTSGNWYYVEYNGVSGYAYSKYLSLQ